MLMSFMSVSGSAATSDFDKPDFAFPKKIVANSLSQLDAAAASGNDRLALRALINYTMAQGSISSDSIDMGLALAEKLRANTAKPAAKAMINLLLAKCYAGLYSSNSWTYNKRELPLLPLPDDYRQWSGDQFRMKVAQLADSVLADPAALQAVRLSDYDGVINIPSGTAGCYPTIFDFAMLQTTQLLNEMTVERPLFPALYMCDAAEFGRLDFSYQPETARRILKMNQQWLSAQKAGTAPFVTADLARLNYVGDHLAGEQSDSTRFSAFMKLYESCSALPEAGNALIRAGECADFDNMVQSARLLSLIDSFTSRHPRSSQARCLTNTRNGIVQPVITAKHVSSLKPGTGLEVKVAGKNADGYQLRVYRVEPDINNYGHYSNNGTKAQPVLVGTYKGTQTRGQVPYAVNDTVTIPFERAGWYIVVPVTSASEATNFKGKSYPIVYCTGLMLSSASYAPKQWAMVVNPQNGQPVGQATVRQYSVKGVLIKSYTTDSDGSVALSGRSGTLRATKGSDTFASPLYVYQPYAPQKGTRYNLHSFTDLALYHQADTVRWCAVAEAYSPGQNRVLPGCELTAVLYDANYQPLDTAKVVTDRFGRAEGSFVLPTSGLTGNFRIQFSGQPAPNTTMRGRVAFMVSDYKLPTFRVDSLKATLDTPQKGSVRLSGRALTYAGFPLDGCAIKLDLSVAERPFGWWWNSGNRTSFYTTQVAAGGDGRFEIELPAALLQQAPVANGLFTAQINATSASGETQQASTMFVLGRPCIVTFNMPADVNITGGVMPVTASLTECNGDLRDGMLRLSLKDNAGRTVLTSEIGSGKKTDVNVSSVPSGKYSIEIAPADTALALPAEQTGRILYRDNDTICPDADATLWTPQTTIRLAPGKRSGEILLGSAADTAYVHYAFVSDTSLVARGWTVTGRRLSRLPVTLPEGADRMTVSLWTANNYRQAQTTVTVVADPQPGISMQIESFRDRIMPGQPEKWTFRITDSQGRGRQAALMLDMYNLALDQLRRHSFSLTPSQASATGYSILYDNSLSHVSSYAAKEYKRNSCVQLQPPSFQTWGMPLTGTPARMFARSLTMAAGGVMVMNEAKMASYDSGNVAKVEEEAAMDSDEAVANEGAEPAIPLQQLRQAEMPLAFFRPMLTTGSDGRLEFSFTAPNANATWRLCAQAFTADMLCASEQRDILSAKPVMVQPNLPRFLRAGDKAIVKALVMNNTDSTACATTRVEIFNPLTGKVNGIYTTTDTIGAMQSATVSVNILASANSPALGYRIYTTQGTFTDGEQAIIPVLEASSPVVETTPFYIAPDEKQFEMQLPATPADARVTLQFCQNPTWYVVTALPGLRKGDVDDASSAGAAIFSAAVASGLLRTNPAIADAIREWTASDRSDSTLVSMLQRNADLKTVLLDCTPWVMDAQSDTERMTRLAMLFDKATVTSTIDRAIDKLTRLDCAGGGWRWVEQSTEPSLWATENLLYMFGRLNQMGFMPDDSRLTKMISNAIAYTDRQMLQQIKQEPKTTDVAYTYLRQIYYPTVPLSGQLADMASRTVKELSAGWKSASAPYKALAAILLNHNGYRTQASQAMESVGQFAVSDAAKGMWWPSVEEAAAMWWTPSAVARTCIILDAYARLMPGSPAIDKIRQWVILQKEAQNWGNSVATTSAIASLLTTGSDWVSPQRQATIKIGGKKLGAAAGDERLGYLRTDISRLSPSGKKLTVSGLSGTPAWGAVYSQYVAPMQEIAAASCPDLSIEKKLLRRVDTPDGTQWVEADTFSVGDVVQVNLLIKAGRTIDYVAVIDQRAACLEPTEQMPAPIWAEGVCFYRENRDSSTNMFVGHLPKGTYRLSYTLTVNNAGNFASGIASAQSQYAPELSAHSSGTQITVN